MAISQIKPGKADSTCSQPHWCDQKPLPQLQKCWVDKRGPLCAHHVGPLSGPGGPLLVDSHLGQPLSATCISHHLRLAL